MSINDVGEDVSKKSRLGVLIAPMLVSVGLGFSFAIIAVFLQDGGTRGYASVVFLLWAGALAILLGTSGAVALMFSRFGLGAGLISSAITFPTTLFLTLLLIRTVNGE